MQSETSRDPAVPDFGGMEIIFVHKNTSCLVLEYQMPLRLLFISNHFRTAIKASPEVLI